MPAADVAGETFGLTNKFSTRRYSQKFVKGKMSSKRNVPSPLRKILNQDEKLSEKFCLFMNKFLPFRSLRRHHKALELTCHGILWLAGWVASIWLFNSPKLYQMQLNFLLGLILDIVFVAVIKAYVRRKRPAGNIPDMPMTFGPDVYSFPSGHASRAAFIMMFFIFLYPLPIFCYPPLMAWTTSLCISRVLMKRHHLLDVFAGVILGIFEAMLMSLIWLGPEVSADVLSFIGNEKASGGDFHV